MRKIVPSWLDMGSAEDINPRPRAPQQHVAGARAPVARLGAREGQHEGGQRRRDQPVHHAALQHGAALRVEPAPVDHEHAAHAVRERRSQLGRELAARLGGREAVQVDAALDALLAPPQAGEVRAVDAAREALAALAAARDLELVSHRRPSAQRQRLLRHGARAAGRRTPRARASGAHRARGGARGRPELRRGRRGGGARDA